MPGSVLIADDNSSIRTLLTRVVRRADARAQVIDTASGADALQLWRQHQPCIVLLDHGLPDLNGFSVLRQLKGQHAPPYVIMITGDPRLEQEALAQGADEVWLKPMDVGSLLQHLGTLLQRVARR